MLLETPITQFNEQFYIKVIQKLEFHLPHVRILGTHHCSKERHENFKRQVHLYDVLCCRDYADWVVYSFDHQIQ